MKNKNWEDWKYMMVVSLIVAAAQWVLFILELTFGHFSLVIFPQAVLWSTCGVYCWSQANKRKENKKITNKENEIDENDLFYENLNEFKEFGIESKKNYKWIKKEF
jgi:predicted membrane protein